MKVLIVTAIFTLLAGCAGTYSSGDTERSSGAAGNDAMQRDDVFHSWIN
ncbi:MAG TPA: hypothetical protein VJ654_09425 [Noviherbaspirillum sp.]|nr:hypothetical protein [Noviherbaspirillum sp.]